MPEDPFMRFVFGTPITARGDTLGKILSRKVMKGVVRDALHADGEPVQKRRRKRAMEEATVSPTLAKLALLNHIAKLAARKSPVDAAFERAAHMADASRVPVSAVGPDGGLIVYPKGRPQDSYPRKSVEKMREFVVSLSQIEGDLVKDMTALAGKKYRPSVSFTTHGNMKPKLLHRLKELLKASGDDKLAEIEKEAPFKSKAQRRKFYAMASRGEISKKEVRKWERETPKGKKLPERIHRKAAAWGLLAGLGRGLLSAGKSVGRGILGAGKFLGRSMIWPTTKTQMGAGMAGWAGMSGVQAGSAHQPNTGMRMSYAADYLLELTKEAALVPVVGSGRSAVGASARPASVNPGTAWLGRSTTKPAKHTKLEGPESRQTVGKAPEASEPGAQAGAHINRPTV